MTVKNKCGLTFDWSSSPSAPVFVEKCFLEAGHAWPHASESDVLEEEYDRLHYAAPSMLRELEAVAKLLRRISSKKATDRLKSVLATIALAKGESSSGEK